MKNNGEHTAHFPSSPHRFVLISLRPEKIEEERGTKDKGHEDAGKDVVGCGTDIVVVRDVDSVICDSLYSSLSIGVVCKTSYRQLATCCVG